MAYPLFDAISRGLDVLQWRENAMEDEDIPPSRIWCDDEKLAEHFKGVRRRMKERYGSGDGWDSEIEDPVQNQAARGMLVG